jgi:hypothetical protein
LENEKKELQKRLKKGEEERKKIEVKRQVMKELNDQRMEWGTFDDLGQEKIQNNNTGQKNKNLVCLFDKDVDIEKIIKKSIDSRIFEIKNKTKETEAKTEELLKLTTKSSEDVIRKKMSRNSEPHNLKTMEINENNDQIINKLENILKLLSNNKRPKEDYLEFVTQISKLSFLNLYNQQMSNRNMSMQSNFEMQSKSRNFNPLKFKKKYKNMKKMLNRSTEQNLRYKRICDEYQKQINKMSQLIAKKEKNSGFLELKIDDNFSLKESDYSVKHSIKEELNSKQSSELPESEYKNFYKN